MSPVVLDDGGLLPKNILRTRWRRIESVALVRKYINKNNKEGYYYDNTYAYGKINCNRSRCA